MPTGTAGSPTFTSLVSSHFDPGGPGVFIAQGYFAIPSDLVGTAIYPAYVIPQGAQPVPVQPA